MLSESIFAAECAAEGGAGDLSRYTCESRGEVPAPESPAKEQPGEQNASPQESGAESFSGLHSRPAGLAPDAAQWSRVTVEQIRYWWGSPQFDLVAYLNASAAAMIAFAAMLRFQRGFESSLAEEIDPNLALA